jgi:peptidoglycan hydrolase CwlO-like protein
MSYNIYQRLEEMAKDIATAHEKIEKIAKKNKELEAIVESRIGDISKKPTNIYDEDKELKMRD